MLESQTTKSKTSPEHQANHKPTVLYMSVAMFLMNASFLMVFSLFPAYLMSLGYSQTNIGILEGVFECLSQLLKFGSGFISDILRKRQALIFLGCGIIFLGRSMIAFSSSFFYILMGRSIDRIGNGVYSIPRDSLISAASSKETRAQSLGFVRSLGQLGSVVGAVIASLLMKRAGFGFRDVFQFAVVPAFIILLIIAFKVKEIPFSQPKTNGKRRFRLSKLKEMGTSFILLMIVNAIFMLGRCNEAFMGTYAIRNFNMAYENVPYIMIVFNISWALFSYPIGVLSDKFGRRKMLLVGIFSMLVSDFFFFYATCLKGFFLGVIFWGMQMGITTNTFTALTADVVDPDVRGTAFGVYYLINAICLFSADAFGGYIADVYGNSYVYFYSFIWGALSFLALMIIMRYRDLTHQN
ncbi:MAG: MFS transporter [Alphaproteobacteria bacterium]|nr:MAG: MFS transporter [Alphaproteobacteria bacterium]